MIIEQSMTHNPTMEDGTRVYGRMEGGEAEQEVSAFEEGPDDQTEWLNLARSTYAASTTYFEENHRDKWDHAISLFRGEHPPGSKYYTDAYKHRSRLFRPKTRSNMRSHEAAAAGAFFSTVDAVVVEPGNDQDPLSMASAEIAHGLLNTRLRRTIPWFQTVVGAYQNTMLQGAVAAKVWWEYEEVRNVEVETVFDVHSGEMREAQFEEVDVVQDRPRVDLVPMENLRFDPDCDWADPAGSSPYLIQMIPMYAGEVLAKMKPGGGSAAPWRELSLETILSSGQAKFDEDTTRQMRRGDAWRKSVVEGDEMTSVWVREYIMKRNGRDMVWHTIGDDVMLSDPVPIEEVYLHGRPFRIGYSMLEVFNPLPDALAYVGRDIQAKANDIDNQRFDNIKLILNKRWFIRRGARINEQQLYRSVPGGSVAMNDPMQDIKADDTRDVTASAYAEQDRVNSDYDDLTGSFSQGSVASNRSLNETVGGMQMLNASSDSVTEYQLNVFAMTFIEPVLNLLAKCLMKYETDPIVLSMAMPQAPAPAPAPQQAGGMMQGQPQPGPGMPPGMIPQQAPQPQIGLSEIPAELLENEVIVSLDVGMGATDPVQRVNKFMTGLNAIGSIPNIAMRIKEDEVIKEVFGRLGYKNGARFFNSQQEQQALQEAQQHPTVMAEEIKAKEAQAQREFKQWEVTQRLELQKELAMLDQSVRYNISMSQLEQRLADARAGRVDKAKVELSKQAIKDQGSRRSDAVKLQEMALKQQMGSGI